MPVIAIIYGNPKRDGFVHGCLDIITDRLEENGASVERIKLLDRNIRDCAGCFTCLRTGACSIEDDVGPIVAAMRKADGFVTGASVRNGYFPAIYKKFFERITYLLGFTHDLRGKHILSVGAVGMAGGKKHLRDVLTLRGFYTVETRYLFFKTGIPGRLSPDDVKAELLAAADDLLRNIEEHAPPPLSRRISWKLDDWVIRTFMLKKNPAGIYDYVIKRWKEKGIFC